MNLFRGSGRYGILCLILFSVTLGGCLATTQPADTSPTIEVESDSTAVVSLIQLQDPLDEPEYYCVDVPGAGASLNLQGALQAHTCKLTSAEDEMFTFNYPSSGQLYMEAYALCAEADSGIAASALYLKECSDQPLQRFEFTNDMQLRLLGVGSESQCLAVAPGVGTPTGGPSHLRRDLMLQPCAGVDPALSQWKMPGSSPE